MPIDAKLVRDHFLAAADLLAAERAVYLKEHCADPELLAAVERLLVAHEQPASVLNQAAPARLDETLPPMPREQPGTIIAGRYKLLEAIGEGGMGTVWLTEQSAPVRRRVALKLIKAGMDTREVLSRFEAERQALALMDHPNIAKVFDGGMTDHGRPFFVMEYVKGLPITQYCDESRLTIAERLGLFAQVCQAVQHAHQKGIIHRDLKPSNILVCLYDGVPVPKVIDFGLAKAMHQSLTERTLYTAHGMMVGTPLYMSPEQAEFNNLDIDTRTDIYSLGVILYELLTGTTPLDRKQFKQAAWQEMLRLIKEEEPPKPSARLSSTDTLASVAASRQSEPARLTRLVRGELDWIVLKALEKDRRRRYETATGFAADVQHYLSDEPVLAAPPSSRYLLRKFARKHRVVLMTATAILFILLAGIAGTTFGLIRAEHRRAEAEQARTDEAIQRKIAEAATMKAEQAEAATLADYRASTNDAIEQLIGSKRELGPQERKYLENTLKRWQAFAHRQGDDERSQAIRGEGHFNVAGLWQQLGRNQEARTEFETARALAQNLVARFPAVPAHQVSLSRTQNNLALLLHDLGKLEEARAEYHAARDIKKKLVAQFPAVPEYQQDLASTHNNLGALLADLGRQDEAQAEWETARDIRKKLVELFPTVPKYQQELAGTHGNLGNLFADLGQGGHARAEYRAARDIYKKLVEQFPAVPACKQDLAENHRNLGNLLRDLGEREEARAEYRAARDVQKKLAASFPSVPSYQQDLARNHNSLGILLAGDGKGDEARAEFQAARDLFKNLVEQFPSVPAYQIGLGNSYGNYGNLIHEEGKSAESLEWFDLAIRTLKPVHEKEPRDVAARQFLRNCLLGRALAYDQLQRPVESVKDWDRFIELSPPAEQLGIRAGRAASRLQAGMVNEAVAEVAELTALGANGLAEWNAGQWYDFACAYALASSTVADKKQRYADRAMELLHKAVLAGYTDADYMKKDTDLDPLREREDFKKLVTELEMK